MMHTTLSAWELVRGYSVLGRIVECAKLGAHYRLRLLLTMSGISAQSLAAKGIIDELAKKYGTETEQDGIRCTAIPPDKLSAFLSEPANQEQISLNFQPLDNATIEECVDWVEPPPTNDELIWLIPFIGN